MGWLNADAQAPDVHRFEIRGAHAPCRIFWPSRELTPNNISNLPADFRRPCPGCFTTSERPKLPLISVAKIDRSETAHALRSPPVLPRPAGHVSTSQAPTGTRCVAKRWSAPRVVHDEGKERGSGWLGSDGWNPRSPDLLPCRCKRRQRCRGSTHRRRYHIIRMGSVQLCRAGEWTSMRSSDVMSSGNPRRAPLSVPASRRQMECELGVRAYNGVLTRQRRETALPSRTSH